MFSTLMPAFYLWLLPAIAFGGDIAALGGVFVRQEGTLSADRDLAGTSGSTIDHMCRLLRTGTNAAVVVCEVGNNMQQPVFTDAQNSESLTNPTRDKALGGIWPGPSALCVATVAPPDLSYSTIYLIPGYDSSKPKRVIERGKQYAFTYSNTQTISNTITHASLVSQDQTGARNFVLVEIGGSQTLMAELLSSGGFKVVATLTGDYSLYYRETPERRRVLVGKDNTVVVVSESGINANVWLINADGIPFMYSGQPQMEFVQTLGPTFGQQEFGFPVDLSGGSYYLDGDGKLLWSHKVAGSSAQKRATSFGLPPSSGLVKVLDTLGPNPNYYYYGGNYGLFALNPTLRVTGYSPADKITAYPPLQSPYRIAINPIPYSWNSSVGVGDQMPGGEKPQAFSPYYGSISDCGMSIATRGSDGHPSTLYGIYQPHVIEVAQIGSDLVLKGNCFYYPELNSHANVFGVLVWGFSSATEHAVSPSAWPSQGEIHFPIQQEWIGRTISFLLVVHVDDGDGLHYAESAIMSFRAQPLPTGTPVIAGVVDGTTFKETPLTNGGWISVFGTNFGRAAQWSGDPNTIILGGASITICGRAAALSYNSGPTGSGWQINALVPYNAVPVTPGQNYICSVVVTVDGLSSPSVVVTMSGAPLMRLFMSGALPIVTHADYSLVGPSSSGLVPANPEETVIAWGTGDCSKPTIIVGGRESQVVFAGRVSPGLCQFDFVVPAGLSGNNALKISSSPDQYSLAVAP